MKHSKSYLGKQLVKLRNEEKVNLYELSEVLNIDVETLDLIEKGKKTINLDLLIDICNLYNKEINYFIKYES